MREAVARPRAEELRRVYREQGTVTKAAAAVGVSRSLMGNWLREIGAEITPSPIPSGLRGTMPRPPDKPARQPVPKTGMPSCEECGGTIWDLDQDDGAMTCCFCGREDQRYVMPMKKPWRTRLDHEGERA